jgi:L-ribulose-5-phosphate 4-epimerase
MATSSIEELKELVFQANLALPATGLVKLTWGNMSIIDRDRGCIVIKPSGVPYDRMSAGQMVVTDLEGKVLAGELKPSSDLPTHLVLYRDFTEIGAVVHTHSKYAVSWAQAGRDIPVYGTTHADTFYGPVPCTRALYDHEINGLYEEATGDVIVETFRERGVSPLAVPGVIVHGHGPFTWGVTAHDAVNNSIVLDEIADMATLTESNNRDSRPISQSLLDKHYYRKHGASAYYGQSGGEGKP